MISKNLTIQGPGANKLTVSGNDASRVFEIMGPANVAISGLTVANGFVSGNPSSDYGFTYVGGGGILVDFGAQLTLLQDAITANHAQAWWSTVPTMRFSSAPKRHQNANSNAANDRPRHRLDQRPFISSAGLAPGLRKSSVAWSAPGCAWASARSRRVCLWSAP